MRFQTKFSLLILPLVAVCVIFMGVWSVRTASRSIETTIHKLMVTELDHFVESNIQTYYGVLKKNKLEDVDSFVRAYQQKSFDSLASFHFIETGSLVILDARGNLLAKAFDQESSHGPEFDDRVIAMATTHRTGNVFNLKTRTGERVFVTRAFAPWNWTLVYSLSLDVILVPQQKIQNTAIGVSMVCIGFGSLLIILGFQFFFGRPVEKLKQVAQRITDLKDVIEIDIHSKDELGDLARSMEKMALAIRKYREQQNNWNVYLESEIEKNTQNLHRANSSLEREVEARKISEAGFRQSEERFKSIFESVTDCILVWDRNYQYLYANLAANEIFGKRKNLVGKDIREGLDRYPAALKLWISRVDQVFETGEAIRVEDALSVGNRVIYSESVVNPIRDQESKIFAVGVVYRDVTRRKQMEQRISETLDFNREIISTSSFGIMVYDESGQCVLVNDAGCKIVAATRPQLLVQNYHEIDTWKTNGLVDLADKVLADGHSRFLEIKGTSTFGKDICLDCRVSRFSMAGNPHLLLVVDDIFERKQMEKQIKASLAEKEILLKEIHHRVKNNLQVVSSILKMQSNLITDKETIRIFRESQDRIAAMSLVHEQLYKSDNLAIIDFAIYIADLVHSLEYSFGTDPDQIHVTVDVRHRDVGVDTAVPCGLIVNELISNAFKYAFGSGERGELSVLFQLQDNGMAQLIITDTGPGIPDDMNIGSNQTLGLKLVNNLATHQLEGTISITRNPGTRVEINFPFSQEKETQRMAAGEIVS